MKLLLDEHFSPEIARQLRTRGHDVVAARARVDLHGITDRDLLAFAGGERRTIVTENVADFAELHREWVLRGKPHSGLVFTSPRRFPRTRRAIGKLVQALDDLLTDGPHDLNDQTWWL